MKHSPDAPTLAEWKEETRLRVDRYGIHAVACRAFVQTNTVKLWLKGKSRAAGPTRCGLRRDMPVELSIHFRARAVFSSAFSRLMKTLRRATKRGPQPKTKATA